MALQLAMEICFVERSLDLPDLDENLLILDPLHQNESDTMDVGRDSRLFYATMTLSTLKNRLVRTAFLTDNFVFLTIMTSLWM